jgi:hypothetical protein
MFSRVIASGTRFAQRLRAIDDNIDIGEARWCAK